MITYITNIVVKKDRTWNLKQCPRCCKFLSKTDIANAKSISHRNKYREPGAVVMVTNCRHCDADLVAGW